MASDGLIHDHCDTVVDNQFRKVFILNDGRLAGGAGNSFDVRAWIDWLNDDKKGDCPIDSDRFVGLILNLDGSVLWVDYKGREALSPVPCAVGSGQDYALGAMEAGATPEQAIAIACKRDCYSGGRIFLEVLHNDTAPET